MIFFWSIATFLTVKIVRESFNSTGRKKLIPHGAVLRQQMTAR
jgi:hypothetical protein